MYIVQITYIIRTLSSYKLHLHVYIYLMSIGAIWQAKYNIFLVANLAP